MTNPHKKIVYLKGINPQGNIKKYIPSHGNIQLHGYKSSGIKEFKMDIDNVVLKILEQEVSPEMQELKKLILRRIATETDIKPSRIPAPLNITQIGGYINLLMKLDKQEQKRILEMQQQKTEYQAMLEQTLTSILGLPMQTSKE